MGARHHAARRFLGRQAGAEREAAADALGRCHDIGFHAVQFVSVEGSGASHAALHLVENQQDAMFVGKIAQSLHEFL